MQTSVTKIKRLKRSTTKTTGYNIRVHTESRQRIQEQPLEYKPVDWGDPGCWKTSGETTYRL